MESKAKLRVTVVAAKGSCAAGHKVGDVLDMDCMKPGGLCGFFYHEIFPSLQTFEYGGRMPWWEGENLSFACPDPMNQITIRVEKADR